MTYLRQKVRSLVTTVSAVASDVKLRQPTESERLLIQELRDGVRALHPIVLNEAPGAEREWQLNMLSLRKTILKHDPRGFLRWKVIVDTMFFSGRTEELLYLQSLISWPQWREAVRESSVGRPMVYLEMKESSGNLLHHAYSLARFSEAFQVEPASLGDIVEFGGGYGSFARLARRVGHSAGYTIFDLAEFGLLQQYFLASVLGPQHGVDLISGPGRLRERLAHSKIDLFVATWSLSESPLIVRELIENVIGRPKFVLIAYQHAFGEVDNVRYFEDFMTSRPQYDWRHESIPHLPENKYLFGRLRG